MIYGLKGLNFYPDAGGGSTSAASSTGAGGNEGKVGGAIRELPQQADQGRNEGETLTFESWIAGQPKEVKDLLDGHTAGLRTALGSEREIREDTEKKLRTMAEKAEKGSESQRQLVEMADKIAESDQKADFYEDAHAAGVTNLKLAYIVAKQEELFDKRGRVNFEAMKKDYPELFAGTVNAAGNAGSGTEGNLAGKGDMNTFIRQSAGRGT
jgi:hypothetical protein